MKPQTVHPVGAPRPMPRIEVSLEHGPTRRRYGRPGAIATLAGLLVVGVAVLVYQAEITPSVAVDTVVALANPPASLTSPTVQTRDAGSRTVAAEPVAVARVPGPAPGPAPGVMSGNSPFGATSAPAQDSRDVAAAVNAWAQAWSQRDMAAYFAAYGQDFKGQATSRAAWQAERQDRITGKASISVTLSDLKIAVQGQRAEVRLTQSYQAGALRTVGPKQLTLARVGGRWLIQQELSGR